MTRDEMLHLAALAQSGATVQVRTPDTGNVAAEGRVEAYYNEPVIVLQTRKGMRVVPASWPRQAMGGETADGFPFNMPVSHRADDRKVVSLFGWRNTNPRGGDAS